MSQDPYPIIAAVLTENFQVDVSRVSREATLESLGLDSLALMEFVFAIEDRFQVRIPEERLNPRERGITLERVAQSLAEQLAQTGAGRIVA